MAEALFKEKKNINGVGFYASIEIVVNINDDPKFLKVDFDKNRVEEEWFNAVEFGIRYFYEHYAKQYARGLSVYVKNLHTMLGDSSIATVFFVTVKCLCQALEYSLDLVGLDSNSAKIYMVK
jgi:hypothetical protein